MSELSESEISELIASVEPKREEKRKRATPAPTYFIRVRPNAKHPNGVKSVKADYFPFMRDGRPEVDVMRGIVSRANKAYRIEKRQRMGAVIRPSVELPEGAMVVVLQGGTYHRLDKTEHPVRQCVNIIKRKREQGRIAWFGPIERLEEALQEIATGENLRPCRHCVDKTSFKYARVKKAKTDDDPFADIEWVDSVLTDKEAERIIERAKREDAALEEE